MTKNTEEQNTFVELMGGTFKLFRWSGHWFPFANPNKSMLLYNFDLYRSILFIVTIPLQFFPCVIDLILKIPDMSKVIMNAISTIYVIHTLFRVLFTILMGNRIWNIFQGFNICKVPEIFRVVDPKLGENVTQRAIKSANKIFMIIILGANITGCLFTVTPFAMSYEARSQKLKTSSTNGSIPNVLIYEAWYPFDVTTFPVYQITLMFQAFSGFIWINMISTSDAVYLSVIVRAIEEIIVLQKMLRTISSIDIIDQNNKNPSRNVNAKPRREEILWPRDANLLLNSWVAHHQLVLRCVEEIERTFSIFVFGVILCNATSLVLLAYVGARIKDVTAVLSIMGFLFVVTTQLFTFSYYGQKLTSKMEELSREFLWIEWWEAPREFQMTLKIISLRASRKIMMTGMGFFILDLEFFIQTVRGAISYFIVLIQLTDEMEK